MDGGWEKAIEPARKAITKLLNTANQEAERSAGFKPLAMSLTVNTADRSAGGYDKELKKLAAKAASALNGIPFSVLEGSAEKLSTYVDKALEKAAILENAHIAVVSRAARKYGKQGAIRTALNALDDFYQKQLELDREYINGREVRKAQELLDEKAAADAAELAEYIRDNASARDREIEKIQLAAAQDLLNAELSAYTRLIEESDGRISAENESAQERVEIIRKTLAAMNEAAGAQKLADVYRALGDAEAFAELKLAEGYVSEKQYADESVKLLERQIDTLYALGASGTAIAPFLEKLKQAKERLDALGRPNSLKSAGIIRKIRRQTEQKISRTLYRRQRAPERDDQPSGLDDKNP